MALKVETIQNGPIQGNAFIAWDEDSKKGVVIDPGDEAERIAACPRVLGVEITEIISTHAHVDHVGGAAELKKILSVPFAIHKDEKPVLETLGPQTRMFGLPEPEIPEVDRWLEDGDVITAGSHEGRIIHTPGHSPGGVSLFFAEAKLLFAGDTLFQGSIGRTDLPGGSMKAIIASIKEKLLPLGDDVRVYCGHGPTTTLKVEAEHNPFLRSGGGMFGF